MLSKVIPILSQYLKKNDTLIVGVSGGPDSTALARIFIEFQIVCPTKIIIAHVNHGIRGKAADRDEKFVRELAEKNGLRCEVKRVKLDGKTGIEERGREVRRAFFQSLLKKYKAQYIVTAHTEDDQLETIIFNFLRGSGPQGLAGMKVVKGVYFKPLLTMPKEEILAYLKEKKQAYCLDSTNKNTNFKRNYIRKKILPLLFAINPSFRQTLLRNKNIFEEIDSLLREKAAQFLRTHQSGTHVFPLRSYKKLHPALQRAVIQEAYHAHTPSVYALPMVKTMEIERMLARGIGNKKIICTGGTAFVLNQGVVVIV